MFPAVSIQPPPKKCKPPRLRHQRIDRERGLCQISARMPYEAALQFASRLENFARITQPEIVLRKFTKIGDSAVVQWQPTNFESEEAHLLLFMASRAATAAEQSRVMSYYPMADRPHGYLAVNEDFHGQLFHWVFADSVECDCGDFRYRCLPLSARYERPVLCHHLYELAWRLQYDVPLLAACLQNREEVVTSPVPASLPSLPAETRQERRTRIEANITRDFA